MKSFILALLCLNVYSQDTEFDRMLKDLLKGIDAPLIKVTEVKDPKDYQILDARKYVEFNTSHLPGAILVGEEGDELPVLDKSKKVLVYCSVGYRSGKVAEKLREKGYQAYNLYGGIFEWVHNDKVIHNSNGVATKKVHTYNKEWSKWLRKGEKVYK